MGTKRPDPAWQALEDHAAALGDTHMRDLFAQDPDRFDRLSAKACGILLDYSKNIATDETFEKLMDLARARDVEGRRTALFEGALVNETEQRAALHTALRAPSGATVQVDGENVVPLIEDVRWRMGPLCNALYKGLCSGATKKNITDIVNIGVGGSHLGPRLGVEALADFAGSSVRAHFLSSTDRGSLMGLLETLSWDTTLFIVSSKSFTTPETILIASFMRNWFFEQGGDEDALTNHFLAVTAHPERARGFGIAEENIFEIWDWVGGRYSLWSAIGLPIAMTIGMERFEDMLEGAHEMDRHFQDAPLEENLPVLMALMGVWYINFQDLRRHAVVPYTRRLRGLPAYLQQLDMESNGKGTHLDGTPLDHATAPVVWGGAGTDVQHSFFQKLHQGHDVTPVDFIALAEPDARRDDYNRLLLANCFAQSEALMAGRTEAEARAGMAAEGLDGAEIDRLAPHRTFPGNRPSNTLLLDRLDARELGALIALYEHKTFVQGAIWGIDSFDQWGVELGKTLAREIEAELQNGSTGTGGHDGSTAGLIRAVLAAKPDGA